MFDRNLELVYGTYLPLYQNVQSEAEKMFTDKIGTISAFHRILIDRVADAYVKVAKLGDSDIPSSAKDSITASDNLRKWVGIALSELHSAALEIQARARFYDKVVDVVDQFVLDISVKRELLKQLRELLEE